MFACYIACGEPTICRLTAIDCRTSLGHTSLYFTIGLTNHLTRCYFQHFLSPYIVSEVNHKHHFIKIPFINKGMEFIKLHSAFVSLKINQ